MAGIPGIIGLPAGIKETGNRVDMRSTAALQSNFDFLIETKTPRFGWARAARCPCRDWNDQTDQVPADCHVCNGKGFQYFQPDNYTACETIGKLTDEQNLVLEKSNAVVIRGFIQGLASQPDMFAVLGDWALGTALLTVRSENLLGYYDRIVDVDGKRPDQEVFLATGTVEKLRYPAICVNFLASIDDRFYLKTDENVDGDYTLVDGNIVWESGKSPPVGTRLSAHFLHRPVWTVIEHMKLTRRSLVKFKKSPDTLTSPAGELLELPGQVLIRLEHLPLDPS